MCNYGLPYQEREVIVMNDLSKLEQYARLILEINNYCCCYYDFTATRDSRFYFHSKIEAVLNFAEKIGLIDFSPTIRFFLTCSIDDSIFDIKSWVDSQLDLLSHTYMRVTDKSGVINE